MPTDKVQHKHHFYETIMIWDDKSSRLNFKTLFIGHQKNNGQMGLWKQDKYKRKEQ